MIKRSALIRTILNLWPPYLGAGIRVKSAGGDPYTVIVEMKLRWWNRNYVKTHFGGSLYAMTDPFFMMILMENLGNDYIIWDKAARIQFKKPGKGTVKACFHIPPAEIERIRQLAETNYKVEPEFRTNIVDEEGNIIAQVHKLLYVRKKDQPK
ncbi:DUF4442 domain-containing protein [Candidatus Odyssella thessalonicensis]|uniref:DUF4442 domain-containing protein n=1 Tax=Candidatus Odyssella thessalonicensis TaxID=84647 RepID=UPI000225B93C|nr:DUF4442 domain-containing protein [Candidatus Odyssella thessalonicensis]